MTTGSRTPWTRDKVARKYYFHRFYEHQADLNTHTAALVLLSVGLYRRR